MMKKRGTKGIRLVLEITDNNMLYDHYLPFLKRGGLFIKTDKPCSLGDEVFLLVKWENEGQQTPVTGSVAWINPKGAQGGRPAGIGVHLSDKYRATRQKIEATLATLPKADKRTHTM
ncbi:MAG: PilZ domain-containing protein [Pseudomonadota bacterium]